MGFDYPQLLIFSRLFVEKNIERDVQRGKKTQIPQNTQTIKNELKQFLNSYRFSGYLDSLCHSINNNVINTLKNTFVLY